mgnify:FL=1
MVKSWNSVQLNGLYMSIESKAGHEVIAFAAKGVGTPVKR